MCQAATCSERQISAVSFRKSVCVCVMRAPAHCNGCVLALMADPVTLEEPAVRWLWGQGDGGRGKFSANTSLALQTP